jgi:hypothetical protein
VPIVTAANAVEHLPIRAIDRGIRAARAVPCARTVRGLKPIAETVSTPVPWPRHQAGAFEACSKRDFPARLEHACGRAAHGSSPKAARPNQRAALLAALVTNA